MKKRSIITVKGLITVSAALIAGFWAIQYNKSYPAGTADKVIVKPISSEMYTEQDYSDAVECVKDFFPAFETCELLELRYAGDAETKLETQDTQKENEEYMVLKSDFYVNPLEVFQNEKSAWQRDYTYKDWGWTLCRTKGTSDWIICNYGYC